MITKTANLFMAKEAGIIDDIGYNVNELLGRNDLMDKIKYHGGNAVDKVKDLLAAGSRNLDRNVVNTIHGGHDGSISDKVKTLYDDLTDKVSRAYHGSKIPGAISEGMYNLKEKLGRNSTWDHIKHDAPIAVDDAISRAKELASAGAGHARRFAGDVARGYKDLYDYVTK